MDGTLGELARQLEARLELERSLGVEYRPLFGRVEPTVAQTEICQGREFRSTAGVEAAPEFSEEPKEIYVAPESAAERKFPTATAAASGSEKEEALAPVRAEAEACRKCGLCQSRNKVVFGEGSPEAEIVFVGEAPGRDEDLQGRPFVGRAGQLLTRMIEGGMKLPRESVYICNILKCRPPNNRDPEADEIISCAAYLHRQLEIIRPKAVVALGRIAANLLAGTQTSMKALRGSWREYRGIPLRATYHPAYLLRQREALGRGNDADKETWADLQEVMRRTGNADNH